jgi:hypothetical protein
MARTTHPGRHRGRRTLATAAAALTLALVGCSGQEDTSGLPPLASATTPTKPTSTGLVLTPEQQAVADAVTRYDTVIKTMADGAPLDKKKIATVAVEPWLTQSTNRLFALKALGNRTVGTYESTIMDISITGKSAKYTKCGDSRNRKVVSIGPSPTLVAKGSKPMVIEIQLVQIDEKWLIRNVREARKC